MKYGGQIFCTCTSKWTRVTETFKLNFISLRCETVLESCSTKETSILFPLFALKVYIPVNIFQSCWDNTVTPMSLELATL